MDHPEYKERTERYREKQILDKVLEQRIVEKINKDERYSDIVFCPVESCGTPVQLEIQKDYIRLHCSLCGFEKMIKRV